MSKLWKSGEPFIWLTGGALVSFAGNSILCRLALREGSMDPATFTTTRLLAGAYRVEDQPH